VSGEPSAGQHDAWGCGNCCDVDLRPGRAVTYGSHSGLPPGFPDACVLLANGSLADQSQAMIGRHSMIRRTTLTTHSRASAPCARI
jgi:hypothetical protein